MGSGPEADWSLDSRLERDSFPVCDLALCHARLMNDANYPWLLLVPRRPHVTEIVELAEPDRVQLMREVSHAAQILKSHTRCDKINVAAIGNVVAQLHVHVIARFRDDAAWPKPVWGLAPARAYESAVSEKLIATLAAQLR